MVLDDTLNLPASDNQNEDTSLESLKYAELVILIALVGVNIKEKIKFEKKHGTSKQTDQFKISFYQCILQYGIARVASLLLLIILPSIFSEPLRNIIRILLFLIPCFLWNTAFAQVLAFFCNLYFQGLGGDWQKCFVLSFDFSSKLIYCMFTVSAIDGLLRQDFPYFYSNSLIIVSAFLAVTIASLLFFSINVSQMITGLSDYENMQQLVKVKNKTQQFSMVIGACYFFRIVIFCIFAFEIRSGTEIDDSWMLALDVFIIEVISYAFSLHHHIDVGQADSRDKHSLEMQNYIPTPLLSDNSSEI